MAFYADEEDVWKCLEHPSRRRAIGVCPDCLRKRLSALCPECAAVRPCSCCGTISASSSSSSSSFSFLSFPGDANFSNSAAGGAGSVGRVSNLLDCEPSYRRSRSAALPFFKSARFSTDSIDRRDVPVSVKKSRSSFWLFFWPLRSKREKIPAEDDGFSLDIRTVRRSKSVAASTTSSCTGRLVEEPKSVKSKGWYFPSPMKVFRHPRPSSKIVQQRSPLHRG